MVEGMHVSHDPDTPDEENPDENPTPEREISRKTGRPKSDRYETRKSIENIPETRKAIISLHLEGASHNDILRALKKRFNISASLQIFFLKPEYLAQIRQEFSDKDLVEERNAAALYMLEAKPQEAWRLNMASRAFVAHLLTKTNLTQLKIAQAAARNLKSISPQWQGTIHASAIGGMIEQKGREGLAKELLESPSPIPKDISEFAEYQASKLSEVVESLRDLKAKWVQDDKARAMAVALLDEFAAGNKDINFEMIATAINKAFPGYPKTTASFFWDNHAKYFDENLPEGPERTKDAVRKFAEVLRRGASGYDEMRLRGLDLIRETKRGFEEERKPDWMKDAEIRGFAAMLLSEAMLPIETVVWAINAEYRGRLPSEITRTAFRDYVDNRDGRILFASVLKRELDPSLFNEEIFERLSKLEGFDKLPAQTKRLIDVLPLERLKVAEQLAMSLALRRKPPPPPRVTVSYMNMTHGKPKADGMPEMRPGVLIDFITSMPDSKAGEGEKQAYEDVIKLRDLLLKEMKWVRTRTGKSTGGNISSVIRALVYPNDPVQAPIMRIDLRWPGSDDESKYPKEDLRLTMTKDFVRTARELVARNP